MDFIRSLKKGAAAAASSYKMQVTIWLTTLLMVLLVALPLKSAFKGIFGSSLSAEKLTGGFDGGMIGDMGDAFRHLMASASTGSLLLVLAGFLLYTFFAGGLFTRFTIAYGELKLSSFMKASAHNFMPFLKIALLTYLTVGIYSIIILLIPAGIILALSDGYMPGMKPMIIPCVIWAAGMPVWLFVADYSRRWVAATGSHKVFRALGAGFSALKKGFWRSYSTVLVIAALNVVFFLVSIWFAAWTVPEKGLMIFLFFLATQILFLIRLFMKSWRYATVSLLVTGPKV